MIKIKNLVIGVIFLLSLIGIASALVNGEDENGNPFYQSEFKLVVPSVEINQLITLVPSFEPSNPELGMVYLDADSKRLKFYDGSGWYTLALEKISTVSKEQVEKVVLEESEAPECKKSTSCGDWGDCINNYQSLTCIVVEEDCNKHTVTKTNDCVSDFLLQTPSEPIIQDDVSEDIPSEDIPEAPVEEVIPEETPVIETPIEDIPEAPVEEVIPEETPVSEEPVQSNPEELFDITFDVEQTSLRKGEKLVLWISLQNFGSKYVPTRLIYTIKDKEGNEVYREFEEFRVYTSQSVIKQFDNLNLVDGDYIVSMSLEYAGVVEEFSQPFSIKTGFFDSLITFFRNLFN